MIIRTKASRYLEYALKGYTAEQIRILEEAEFHTDLSKIKGSPAPYYSRLPEELNPIQNTVYQRHLKLVQALRLNRDVIKQRTGADVDPDKWDFSIDNHAELLDFINQPEEEVIRYADEYVLQKASHFFQVTEKDIKDIVKDYLNPLPIKQDSFKSIFNDGGYDICIKLLKETGIIDSNLRTLITKEKAGHLFGVIIALKVKCKFNANITFTEKQLVEKFNEALSLKCKYPIKKKSDDYEESYDEAIDILSSS